jgi:hypothetical protein
LCFPARSAEKRGSSGDSTTMSAPRARSSPYTACKASSSCRQYGHHEPRKNDSTNGPFAKNPAEVTVRPSWFWAANVGAICPTAATPLRMPDALRSAVARSIMARLSGGTRAADAARVASSLSFSDIVSAPVQDARNCRSDVSPIPGGRERQAGLALAQGRG